MQACVLTFNPRTGTGLQTVTGVVDRDGNPFVGTLFLFQGAAPTTVDPGDWINHYCDIRGFDTVVARSGSATGDEALAGGKICSNGSSLGEYSVIDYRVQTLFGGAFYQLAKVVDSRLGEFDLQFDLNDRTGRTVLCTVFGGDDLTILHPSGISLPFINGTHSLAAKPQGLLTVPSPVLASSGFSGTAAGGQSVSWGWDTPRGDKASAVVNVVNQGNNFRAQRDSTYLLQMGDTGTLTPGGSITAWGDDTYTVANNDDALVPTGIFFCGPDIRTTAGKFTSRTTTGTQVIDVDLDARWIMFLSTGPASPTSSSPLAEMTHGWAAGSSQVGFWGGEKRVGNVQPLFGWRNLDTASVLRFADPNYTSTVYSAVAEVVSIATDGLVTLNWTANDAVEREIYWFAIGTEVAPPPGLGMLLTQLPLIGAGPYDMIFPLLRDAGRDWATPAPQRSRRGR